MSEPAAALSPRGWPAPPTPGAGRGPNAPTHPRPAIPDHELLHPIGRGAYGEVWLGRTVVGTLRAVKIVHRRDFGDSQPFDREFKGLQRFEPVSRAHPGLVDILQIGRNDAEGFFYHVMELADAADGRKPEKASPGAEVGNERPDVGRTDRPAVDGPESPCLVPTPGSSLRADNSQSLSPSSYLPRTLRHEVKTRGRLPMDECLRIGLALAGALEHLHRHGLVHRDVKPSNIIFVQGQPKLADIGLVSDAGDSQSIVGTEGYLAPEGPGTPQADLFSLGKVLYEISTGQDRRHFPDLPADLKRWPDARRLLELNEVVLKACARDATRRYRSAAAMRMDLERLQAGGSLQWRRTLEQAGRQVRRLGTALAVGALALLLLPRLMRRPQPEPRPVLPEKASVFVLPFRDEGTHPIAEDLRGRMTDAFIDSLALIEGVRRSPRKSGWAHHDEDQLRRSIAMTNDMQHILTGRIGATGENLTLALRLYPRAQRQPVWSERFSATTNEVVDLERRALRRMTEILGLTVTEVEQRRINQKLSNNLEALYCLRKAWAIYEHQAGTQAGHEQIQSLAHRALELDPLYLDADMCDVVIHRDLSLSKSPLDQLPNMRVRLLNILAHDDTFSLALHQMGGYLLSFARDWEALSVHLEREFSVGDPKYRDFGASLWSRTHGWMEEASRRQELWDQKGDNASVFLFHRAAARRVERRYAEAVQVSRQLRTLYPGNAWGYLALAHSLIANGEYEASLEVTRQGQDTLHRAELTALRAYAYAKMGQTNQARAVLSELMDLGRMEYLQPYFVARVHAALGENQKALDWLEKAEADKSEFLMFVDVGGLRTDPAWDGLQNEPRYWQLCDRLGLGRNQWPRPAYRLP